MVELDYVDRFSIGSEVVRWEYAIAMAGVVLGINPFDQPDVEAAKQAAAKVLEDGMPNIPVEPVEKVLSTVNPGDYIAIQAFIDTEFARHRCPATRTHGVARQVPRRHDAGDRPPLSAFDRPAAQGRPAERRVSPDRRR